GLQRARGAQADPAGQFLDEDRIVHRPAVARNYESEQSVALRPSGEQPDEDALFARRGLHDCDPLARAGMATLGDHQPLAGVHATSTAAAMRALALPARPSRPAPQVSPADARPVNGSDRPPLPHLSSREALTAEAGGGLNDAVIAAAPFLPAETRFDPGGVRIGAGTGNMGLASCGGGARGATPLMNSPGINARATAPMVMKVLIRMRPDLGSDP
ncbi:MAG: hypothetical protein V7668_00005, partial [Cereibacter changlensis]